MHQAAIDARSGRRLLQGTAMTATPKRALGSSVRRRRAPSGRVSGTHTPGGFSCISYLVRTGVSAPPPPPSSPALSCCPPHRRPPGRTTVTAPSPKVVATGLNNPRHVRASNGALYVAEAGVGGSGPCIAAGEGVACYGESGSITRIKYGRQARVVTRLPSVAERGGDNASGPADVQVRGRYYTLALGLGAESVGSCSAATPRAEARHRFRRPLRPPRAAGRR